MYCKNLMKYNEQNSFPLHKISRKRIASATERKWFAAAHDLQRNLGLLVFSGLNSTPGPGPDSSGWGWGPAEGSCEDGNEPSGW
jgi:hypothetical protein